MVTEDDEDEADEDNDEKNSSHGSEEGEIDEMIAPTYFLRRHSLPVSSPFINANLHGMF